MLILFFWFSLAVVAYTYVGYPLALGGLARWKRRPRLLGPYHGSVSIVVAVRNEEANLPRRLRELTSLMRASDLTGEILVVSNGSTDRTVAIAEEFAEEGVRALALPEGGKAEAVSAGAAAARHDILVFADARQTWAPDALARLVENFADPAVGAVSGDLVLEAAPGILAGVGFYWRFEKWLRKKESDLFSQVGVTGAICAVRRALFQPIPPNTLLDDVYWPLQVALQGYRVVHDERARAFDRLPARPHDEFWRKVRTLAGNYQLMARFPQALLPRKSIWWQFLSHKLLRLAVPWLLGGLLVSSWFLPDAYGWFFWTQVAGYSLALLGLVGPVSRRIPLLSAAGSFLVLNAAAWLGFWVWLTGRATRVWHKAAYRTPPLDATSKRSAAMLRPKKTQPQFPVPSGV